MALKRDRSPSPGSAPDVFISKTIDEQTSTFIGAFSRNMSVKALQQLPDFRTATHRMAAWRKPSRQKSLMPNTKIIYDLGHDDDGEKWAGTRLQNVLKDTQTEGVVVVARWYGGQNIGPIRFTHIENCAKEAIWKAKVASTQTQQDAANKKIKTDQEAKRLELVKNLQDRDFSIITLRKLLNEKKVQLQEEEFVPPTPQKPQDYSKMTLEALGRVEKARDKTIAFVLQQIDKIEEDLKLVEALEAGMDEEEEGEQGDGAVDKQGKEEPSTPK